MSVKSSVDFSFEIDEEFHLDDDDELLAQDELSKNDQTSAAVTDNLVEEKESGHVVHLNPIQNDEQQEQRTEENYLTNDDDTAHDLHSVGATFAMKEEPMDDNQSPREKTVSTSILKTIPIAENEPKMKSVISSVEDLNDDFEDFEDYVTDGDDGDDEGLLTKNDESHIEATNESMIENRKSHELEPVVVMIHSGDSEPVHERTLPEVVMATSPKDIDKQKSPPSKKRKDKFHPLMGSLTKQMLKERKLKDKQKRDERHDPWYYRDHKWYDDKEVKSYMKHKFSALNEKEKEKKNEKKKLNQEVNSKLKQLDEWIKEQFKNRPLPNKPQREESPKKVTKSETPNSKPQEKVSKPVAYVDLQAARKAKIEMMKQYGESIRQKRAKIHQQMLAQKLKEDMERMDHMRQKRKIKQYMPKLHFSDEKIMERLRFPTERPSSAPSILLHEGANFPIVDHTGKRPMHASYDELEADISNITYVPSERSEHSMLDELNSIPSSNHSNNSFYSNDRYKNLESSVDEPVMPKPKPKVKSKKKAKSSVSVEPQLQVEPQPKKGRNNENQSSTRPTSKRVFHPELSEEFKTWNPPVQQPMNPHTATTTNDLLNVPFRRVIHETPSYSNHPSKRFTVQNEVDYQRQEFANMGRFTPLRRNLTDEAPNRRDNEHEEEEQTRENERERLPHYIYNYHDFDNDEDDSTEVSQIDLEYDQFMMAQPQLRDSLDVRDYVAFRKTPVPVNSSLDAWLSKQVNMRIPVVASSTSTDSSISTIHSVRLENPASSSKVPSSTVSDFGASSSHARHSDSVTDSNSSSNSDHEFEERFVDSDSVSSMDLTPARKSFASFYRSFFEKQARLRCSLEDSTNSSQNDSYEQKVKVHSSVTDDTDPFNIITAIALKKKSSKNEMKRSKEHPPSRPMDSKIDQSIVIKEKTETQTDVEATEQESVLSVSSEATTTGSHPLREPPNQGEAKKEDQLELANRFIETIEMYKQELERIRRENIELMRQRIPEPEVTAQKVDSLELEEQEHHGHDEPAIETIPTEYNTGPTTTKPTIPPAATSTSTTSSSKEEPDVTRRMIYSPDELANQLRNAFDFYETTQEQRIQLAIMEQVRAVSEVQQESAAMAHAIHVLQSDSSHLWQYNEELANLLTKYGKVIANPWSVEHS